MSTQRALRDSAPDTLRATTMETTAVAADPPVRPAPWHAAAIVGSASLLVAIAATWVWRRMRTRPAGGRTP